MKIRAWYPHVVVRRCIITFGPVDFISGLQRQNSVDELSLSALDRAMLLQAPISNGPELGNAFSCPPLVVHFLLASSIRMTRFQKAEPKLNAAVRPRSDRVSQLSRLAHHELQNGS